MQLRIARTQMPCVFINRQTISGRPARIFRADEVEGINEGRARSNCSPFQPLFNWQKFFQKLVSVKVESLRCRATKWKISIDLRNGVEFCADWDI